MNNMEFEIAVYNSQGEPQQVNIDATAIDLSELPAGAYTICFRQGEDSYTTAFAKK